MKTSIMLTEPQLGQRIAEVLKAEGFGTDPSAFRGGVSFNFDSGDGPYSGSGLSASVSVKNPDGLTASVRLNKTQLADTVAASLTADGYTVAAGDIVFSYDRGGGTQFDSGNGATATVFVTGARGLGFLKLAIVPPQRQLSMYLYLYESQLRERFKVALAVAGYTLKNDWVSLGYSENDRGGGGSVTCSAIVAMPGDLTGSVYLDQAQMKEKLAAALKVSGYTVAANDVLFSYDKPTGMPTDPGNGVTASVKATNYPKHS